MTLDNFIPTLWSGKIQENLNDAHVYVDCCNRDFEGEFSEMGVALKINSHGRVTIRAYTKNALLTAPETLVDSGQFLVIDQGSYFNFAIDDVDDAQTKPKLMSSMTMDAAWGLSDASDVVVATAMNAAMPSAGSGNTLANRAIGTGAGSDDAYETLVDLGVVLDTNNVPKNGQRWAVVPPWYVGALAKDQRYTSFGTPENIKNLKNGLMGVTADGLAIKVSNNVPTTGSGSSQSWDILVGYEGATTYAEQIPGKDFEAFRPPDRFADALKGLLIYGVKVTRPYGLAKITVVRA